MADVTMSFRINLRNVHVHFISNLLIQAGNFLNKKTYRERGVDYIFSSKSYNLDQCKELIYPVARF